MNRKLSPGAARAKYEYNKKYQDRYWERKAAKQSQQKADNGVSVSRSDISDSRYIKALERSNRTLNSENRRLAKMLHNYQTVIGQSKLAVL